MEAREWRGAGLGYRRESAERRRWKGYGGWRGGEQRLLRLHMLDELEGKGGQGGGA